MNDQLALALGIPPPRKHPLPDNWKPFDLAQLPTLSGIGPICAGKWGF